MIVLGVNGYLNADHDAASALFMDGRLVAAVEEERLTRRKRAFNDPPHASAAEVLQLAGISSRDVDVVAYPWNPDLLGEDRAIEALKIRADLAGHGVPLRDDVEVEFIDHHVAHAWSALLFTPPHLRDHCDIVVLDGSGENTSGSRFRFGVGGLVAQAHYTLESSLGYMFEAAASLAGFRWGEEGKLMGLASYVDAKTVAECAIDGIATGLAVEVPGRVIPVAGDAHRNTLTLWGKRLRDAVGGIPVTFLEKARLAALAQAALERRVAELVFDCRAPVVALAGGSALNCSSNGKLAIELRERGQQLIVPPCANDTGVALGAAAAIAARTDALGYTDTAGHGRVISWDSINALSDYGVYARAASVEEIADRIVGGGLVGWMSDPAEIGPRALGGRAILANAGSTRVRDRVNVAKGRETWRPLAPSVSLETFECSFVGISNSFMLNASWVHRDAKGLDGVTHADGTARPQVVPPEQSAYLAVIHTVSAITGGPAAVICTSFNSAGEPMVYSAADGLHSACRMGLDAIAGDGWIVELSGRGEQRGR